MPPSTAAENERAKEKGEGRVVMRTVREREGERWNEREGEATFAHCRAVH